MSLIRIFFIFFSLILLFSCSASYEELTNNSFYPKSEIDKHLFIAYKEKAEFEAKEMHDWDSAKLYSEKAIQAAKGNKILPQNINYWNISPEKNFEISKAYNNLLTVYEEALKLDPYHLAKAISSLDCWSEQQEENWQTWDINKCRDDFLNAMHILYDTLSDKKDKVKDTKIFNDSASIVTQNNNKEILQIIYFDFDKSKLSNVAINEVYEFIKSNKEIISNYLIVGHTDTKGTKKYNQKLSIERAETVKSLLIKYGISSKKIKILGEGEDVLRVKTSNEVSHPANRRAEISVLN